MQMSKYFEKLNFNDGKKINVSKEIDLDFSDTIHWHPYVEILVSLLDQNEVTINFTKYRLNKNDLAMIYPGDLHTLDHVDKDAYIVVQFPLDLLMIMSEFNSNFSIFYQYHHIKYDPGNADIENMIALIRQMPELYFSDTLFNEVQIYALLLEFFVKFGQYCISAKEEEFSADASAEYKSIKRMAEACLYISQNCTKPLTLDDISNHMGFSKYHFSHLFKTYTNMTFIDFLTTERIKRAEDLIANPQVQIINIAFESGFSSVSSFNRAFKKIKGISPSEFRKTLISDNGTGPGK